MSIRRLVAVLGCLAVVTCLFSAAAEAEDAAGFEKAPRLTAEQILGKGGVSGPGWSVRPQISFQGFLAHFEVETAFGLYRVSSVRMLRMRTHEIQTMQRLRKMGESNAYLQALTKRLEALPSSLVAVGKRPDRAVANVPKAATKTFGRVGKFLGGIGKSGSAGARLSPEEVRAALVEGEKRKLAAELKVDVYSTNEKLQRLLDSIATARYAGEFTLSLAASAIPGGVGSVLYGTASYNNQIVEMLTDKNEDELREANRAGLAQLGVQPYLVDHFLDAKQLSPRHQTVIATSLRALQGVKRKEAILEAALEAVDETRAFLQESQAVTLARYHRLREPLVELARVGGIVLARTQSGNVVVCAPVDLLWNTPDAELLLRSLAASPLARRASQRTLEVKGRITQAFQQSAARAGFSVVSGWLWVPKPKR